MNKLPLGVLLESFRLPLNEALNRAQALGLQGVQMYATQGETSPEGMSPARRRAFLRQLDDHGLRLSALCGDLGQGFHDPQRNPKLIERSKRILDFAKALGTDVVTTHIGVIPDNPAHPRYAVMRDACGELARYADELGAHFAVETGPERADTLKRFLDGLHSTGVGVNLDPANLVMVTGDDPVRATRLLKPYIVHTHAKDGRRLFERDPELVYGVREDDVVTDASFEELPLGKGDVDLRGWLDALCDIGYQGFLTIEREVGDDPEVDIRLAADTLRALMA